LRALPRAGCPRRGRGDRRGDPGSGRGTAVTVRDGAVFDDLVGQERVIERLRGAVAGDMTHAWLFTGPPGSGRSNAAIAFAAPLKAIEEPNQRTVWLLCAPTVEDVLPTIRSRTRLVVLATPSSSEVAEFLVRTDGVDRTTAVHAARASQGHIGRARALARDEDTRGRRHQVVQFPARLRSEERRVGKGCRYRWSPYH